MTQVLAFGTALALVLSLAALRVGRYGILSGIEEDSQRDAAGAVWDALLVPMVQSTWALMLLAVIVGLTAWATGHSMRAENVRSWVSRTIDSWRRPSEEPLNGFTAFLLEWKRTIQVVSVVIGLIFVLFGPAPSGLLVIITTLFVLGAVVFVELFAGPETTPAEDLESAGL
jgi:hypothetical protein